MLSKLVRNVPAVLLKAVCHSIDRHDTAWLVVAMAYAVSNPCDLAARFRIRQFRAWRSFSVSAASTVPLAMTTP
jgi:hypothetical protein